MADLGRVPGQQAIEGRGGVPAVWTAEITELDDGDGCVCRASRGSASKVDVRPGSNGALVRTGKRGPRRSGNRRRAGHDEQQDGQQQDVERAEQRSPHVFR
jgi:hypothetical protein